MSYLIESTHNQLVSTCITFSKKEDGLNYFLNELESFLSSSLITKTKEVIELKENYSLENEYISFSITTVNEEIEVKLNLFNRLVYKGKFSQSKFQSKILPVLEL